MTTYNDTARGNNAQHEDTGRVASKNDASTQGKTSERGRDTSSSRQEEKGGQTTRKNES